MPEPCPAARSSQCGGFKSPEGAECRLGAPSSPQTSESHCGLAGPEWGQDHRRDCGIPDVEQGHACWFIPAPRFAAPPKINEGFQCLAQLWP